MTEVRPETISDDMVRALRDSQPVNRSFKPIYDSCVRYFGMEPRTGGYLDEVAVDKARRDVCRYLNAILAGVCCPGCGGNQTHDDGRCWWCGVKYRNMDAVLGAIRATTRNL